MEHPAPVGLPGEKSHSHKVIVVAMVVEVFRLLLVHGFSPPCDDGLGIYIRLQ